MKRKVILILFLCVVLTINTLSLAETTGTGDKVELVPSKTTLNPGDTFDVKIDYHIDGGTGGYEAILNYPKDRFEVKSLDVPKVGLASDWQINEYANVDKGLKLNLLFSGTQKKDEGTSCIVTFEVNKKYNGKGTEIISLSDISLRRVKDLEIANLVEPSITLKIEDEKIELKEEAKSKVKQFQKNDINYYIVEKDLKVSGVLDYFKAFKNGDTLCIKDLKSTDNVKTGSEIKITGKENKDTKAKIIMKGDVDLDGKVTFSDVTMLNSYRLRDKNAEDSFTIEQKLAYKSIKNGNIEIENNNVNFTDDVLLLNTYRLQQ